MFVYDDDFTDGWTDPVTVVLQHGFARNGELWRGWVPHLSRRFRVLRPDLPGCGRSPFPGEGFEYSTDEFVSETLKVLDDRDIERVHYVGEGIGGVIGASLAGRYPDRVLSLTAMTMPLRVDPSIQQNHALEYGSWQEAIEKLGVREWWRRARAASQDLAGDEAIDSWIADQVGQTPVEVAVALTRWAVSWRYEELLPAVQSPVLLVWSEEARFVSTEQRERIAALAKEATVHLVPGVRSQMYPFIYPDEVAPKVAEFIAEHEG